MGNIDGFDASKVEPTVGFTALPAGDYAACIVGSVMKPTKDGGGELLELKLQITQGEFKNRLIFDRLNLKNKNEQAVQISRGTLSAICRAVGVLTPDDSSELHNRPLLVKLSTREYKGEPTNEVKGYNQLPAEFDASTSATAPETPWG